LKVTAGNYKQIENEVNERLKNKDDTGNTIFHNFGWMICDRCEISSLGDGEFTVDGFLSEGLDDGKDNWINTGCIMLTVSDGELIYLEDEGEIEFEVNPE
jgi:hypothetical protein